MKNKLDSIVSSFYSPLLDIYKLCRNNYYPFAFIFSCVKSIIIFLFIASCSPGLQPSKIGYYTYNLNNSFSEEDSATQAIIKPYKVEMEKKMNEVLNISDMAMTKDQPEGLLGNFVSDLILKKGKELTNNNESKNDLVCILNNGGLRTSLPKGEITRGKVFELMPFENELTLITISGSNLKSCLEYLAAEGGTPVAGIKMGIENKIPVEIFINGNSFDEKKNYRVITSDYLANGGDKYFFFRDPLSREDLGIKVREAIISYCLEEKKMGRHLTSQFDGRIYYVH